MLAAGILLVLACMRWRESCISAYDPQPSEGRPQAHHRDGGPRGRRRSRQFPYDTDAAYLGEVLDGGRP